MGLDAALEHPCSSSSLSTLFPLRGQAAEPVRPVPSLNPQKSKHQTPYKQEPKCQVPGKALSICICWINTWINSFSSKACPQHSLITSILLRKTPSLPCTLSSNQYLHLDPYEWRMNEWTLGHMDRDGNFVYGPSWPCMFFTGKDHALLVFNCFWPLYIYYGGFCHLGAKFLPMVVPCKRWSLSSNPVQMGE